jgi:uncharacterized damage-inducible protein DinB
MLQPGLARSWQTWGMYQDDVNDRFGYLYWIRDRALAQAAELPEDAFVDPTPMAYRDLRSTLVHELDVERSWRLRLQGAPIDIWDITLQPADYPDVATLADHWQRDEADMLAWIAELTDDELSAPVSVNGLEGFPLATYLVHVVMHGVQSLSAAAILLHQRGQSMGDVDYLDFVDAVGSSS